MAGHAPLVADGGLRGVVMADANSLGIQTYEADVKCGMWCQGGSVKFYPTDHPHYTDIADVWVKGSDALELVNGLRAELAQRKAPADCRLCAQLHEGRCLLQARKVPVVCINGDAFVKVLPIRLYAIDAAMAGGAK